MHDDLPDLPCYLNGEFTRLPQARISVMDRGFIFGDGVYEVIPVYAGHAFRITQHLQRLERSLRELRIANPLSTAQWTALIDTLVQRLAQQQARAASDIDQLVYLQVTRGVAMRDHVMPSSIQPTVFAMTNTMKQPSAHDVEQGVRCVTADDFRWKKAHIKSTSLLGAVFSRQISADQGATETVMFRDGWLSEAAASNVWVVKDGRVMGPPKDNLVLEGIRYGLLEELCAASGLPLELRRISRDEVLQADELLLSSATKEVLAITRLDDRPVGDGRPGPVGRALRAAYQDAKRLPGRGASAAGATAASMAARAPAEPAP